MEKWKKAALVVCFLFAGQVVGAEPNDSYLGLFKASNFEIGPEIFSHVYKEPGLNLKDSGTLYGVYWSYTYREWLAPPDEDADETPAVKPACKWMWGADGDIAYGKVDYHGFSENQITGEVTPASEDGLTDWLIDVRFLFGPDFPHETRMDTLYTGLGFRYLNNDGPHDEGFYERESRYLYLPVGITTLGNLCDGWVLGVTGEFDVLLYGNQSSHLSDADSGFPNVDNPQHEGYGVRGSIRLGKQCKNYSFMVEPFVRYWKIQTSEVTSATGTMWRTTGTEPENDTTEIGARLIWRF